MKTKIGSSVILAASISLVSVPALTNESDPLEQALMVFDQGHYQVAEDLFLKQANHPGHKNQALMYLGWAQLRQGKTEAAVDSIEQALEIAPNTAEELVISGDIYCDHAQKSSIFAALKIAKKCIAQYEAAVQLEPDNVEALVPAMQFYLGAPSIAGGSSEKGHALLDKLKILSPEDASTYHVFQLDQSGKTHAAMALADDLVKQGVNSAKNQYQLARFYRDKKHYEKALSLFSSMGKFAETTKSRWYIQDSLLQQGEILMEDNRDVPQAIKLMEEYKQKNKNPGDIHYFWSTWSLAKAYRASGRQDIYDQLVNQIAAEDYKSNKEFAKQFKNR